MTINKTTFRTLYVLPALTVILICQNGFTETCATAVTKIKSRDAILNADVMKVATFVMSQQANYADKRQGFMLQDCTAAWTPSTVAMNIMYTYEEDPVYVAPGSDAYTRNDYDAKMRLIVWRFIETNILKSTTKNEKIDKTQVFFVDPNGHTEPGGISITKHIFPANGGYDGAYSFNQFLLATGLGFSGRMNLNDINSVEVLHSGEMQVIAPGSYGKDLHGRWKLTIDPSSDYSIKNASFTLNGAAQPSISMTMGRFVEKGGIMYAESANLKLSPLTIDVSVDDISISTISSVYEKVVAFMSKPLPAGSQIIDLRGAKPVTTTVKAENNGNY